MWFVRRPKTMKARRDVQQPVRLLMVRVISNLTNLLYTFRGAFMSRCDARETMRSAARNVQQTSVCW